MDHDETSADVPADGNDIDGLVTLPGVHSASGDEKAGTGDSDDMVEGTDPEAVHEASDEYPPHPGGTV